MNKRNLLRLARQAISTPSTDHECVSCYRTMDLPYGLDPTALCNTCAQDALTLLAQELIKQLS